MAARLAYATPQACRGIGMTSMRTRERLIQRLRDEGISNDQVLAAMLHVPRHLFVEEAWASRSYEDTALPIGYNQTISQPYIVARMTEALLEDGPLESVLEIGTGSGYQTAIIARLVDQVHSVERIRELLLQAEHRVHILGSHNVRYWHRDGCLGLPDVAPFDGILVAASPEGIPRRLIHQLRVGGRMLIPIGTKNMQALVKVTRTPEGYDTEMLEKVAFVPLLEGVDG